MGKLTEEEKAKRKVVREENKRVKAIEDEKKRIANRLISDIDSMRKIRINEPSRHFLVGEEVSIGNLEYCEIKEVFDGGKFYRVYVERLCKENSSRKTYMDKSSNNIWKWTNIHKKVPLEELKKREIIVKERLHLQFFNTHLSSLFHTYENCDLEPEYQRGNAWNESQRGNLIDSIFRDIDIGKFVFIRLPYTVDGYHDEILDGKQRLCTIIDFYEGRFPYQGKYYSEMHPRDRDHFRDYMVHVAEAPKDITDAQKYEYFLRLNVCGEPQDPKHIAKVQKMFDKATNV